MKIITLSQGQATEVDDWKFDGLNCHKWRAWKNPRNGDFYARRNIKTEKGYRQIIMHREIMNCPKGMIIDHINFNTLDNRESNLRVCTYSESSMHRRKQSGCSSQYIGVYWHKKNGKWIAYIVVNKKPIHLGCFDKENDAGRAYNVAALKYFGEFAELNVIC